MSAGKYVAKRYVKLSQCCETVTKPFCLAELYQPLIFTSGIILKLLTFDYRINIIE